MKAALSVLNIEIITAADFHIPKDLSLRLGKSPSRGQLHETSDNASMDKSAGQGLHLYSKKVLSHNFTIQSYVSNILVLNASHFL